MEKENVEKFNSDEYIRKMVEEGKSPHIQLMGRFFKEKKMFFPTKEIAQMEVRRWVKDARFVSAYPDRDITAVFVYVKREYPEMWNLSTMRKYIAQARNLG